MAHKFTQKNSQATQFPINQANVGYDPNSQTSTPNLVKKLMWLKKKKNQTAKAKHTFGGGGGG